MKRNRTKQMIKDNSETIVRVSLCLNDFRGQRLTDIIILFVVVRSFGGSVDRSIALSISPQVF